MQDYFEGRTSRIVGRSTRVMEREKLVGVLSMGLGVGFWVWFLLFSSIVDKWTYTPVPRKVAVSVGAVLVVGLMWREFGWLGRIAMMVFYAPVVMCLVMMWREAGLD